MVNNPPSGLEPAGLALWNDTTDVYELTPAELRLLEDACREADLIAHLDTEWNRQGRPLTALGSNRQTVAHPIPVELRQHRSTLRQLLKDLKLPGLDEPADVVPLGRKMTRSESGRYAANVRHGNVG